MSQSTSDPAHSRKPDASREHERLERTQQRILELELLQVRKEAAAARLEARAAEIERLLHQERLRSAVFEKRGQEESAAPCREDLRRIESQLEEPVDSGATSQTKTVEQTARPPAAETHQHAQSLSDAIDDESEVSSVRRSSRRSALVISVLGHVVIVLLLAAIGLRLKPPKDQIAITASVSASEPSTIQTVQIENVVPATEEESESQQDIESELIPDPMQAGASMTPPSLESLGEDSIASSFESTGVEILRGDASASQKMEFFGVEGGGNHFVYLVDSSKSMGAAFESARDELVRSIQALRSDQRFYVVFFDADSDYMRIRDPNVNDPMSLSATDANKVALTQWANRIKMDDGRAPYEPLRFALGLKPDVIFLLSDGEFPAGIEDLLTEDNYVENLFGDVQRISIVHTIGYHSQRGEERMRRIAEKNGGQYRYLRKP